MTSTPRVTYALAGKGSLPRWFGAVSPRYATPANSVLFMGLLGDRAGVTGSFVWLAVVSTLARLFVYARQHRRSAQSGAAGRRRLGADRRRARRLRLGGGAVEMGMPGRCSAASWSPASCSTRSPACSGRSSDELTG